MKTLIAIVTVIALTVNVLHAQTTPRSNERDQQRYAERIAVTKQLEEYAEKNFSINDIIRDAAVIQQKRVAEKRLAQEKREEQQRGTPPRLSLPIIMPVKGGYDAWIVEQETNRLLAECQRQVANIFRFYPNIPVKDIANDAKRIENQIPRNAINPEIKIDSDTAILLTFEFIKDFCSREARKRPPSKYIPGRR